MFPFDDYDRRSKNEDGSMFYGYDDDTGKTTWYDSNGDLDSISETPEEGEYDQDY